MPDIKIYKTQDLILEVKKTFDPKKLNLKQWVDFLDVLCGDREYQKEAITNEIIAIGRSLNNSRVLAVTSSTP